MCANRNDCWLAVSAGMKSVRKIWNLFAGTGCVMSTAQALRAFVFAFLHLLGVFPNMR